MPFTVTEIHLVDERGRRRVAEIYPPEDRVTPVCVHSTDAGFSRRLLEMDILLRPPAPFQDAPRSHRPEESAVHRAQPQPNYFTTVSLEETLTKLLEGLPGEGLPRYETRQRVQRTKY
ncbi:MAG: hypothetical protein H0V09_09570 [Gemmatimonadetes bacterium]|nr:hypothetical protein [Gemmatimonadota bacterium]